MMHLITHTGTLMIFLIFTQMVCPRITDANSSFQHRLPLEKATHSIREAAHATEEAWEEFHAAAIGGTLASPLIQVTIEQQLHDARALLMKARIAKREKYYAAMKDITTNIQEITQQIIQASRKRKQ